MKIPFNRKKPFASSHHSNISNQSEKISPFAWKVLFILSAIAALVMYAETMISIAIPEIIKEFDISYNTSSWILTLYLIVGGIMTPISGKLSDVYGRKKILLLIVTTYVIGVIIGGFSSNIYFLLAARILQGIGISFFPIAYSIIKNIFPTRKMAIGQGIVTSMFASGAVLGILLGGPIIQYYGWNMTYYSLIPVAVGLLVIVGRVLSNKIERDDSKDIFRKKEIQEQKILIPKTTNTSNSKFARTGLGIIKDIAISVDIKGALLLAVSITSLLLLLTSFENGSSSSNNILGLGSTLLTLLVLLTIGIISLMLFVFVELRNNYSPLVDIRLLARKLLLIPNLLALIVGFWTFMIFYTIPILAKSPTPVGFGITSVDTSFLLLPFAIVSLIFGPTSGYIISKLGSTKPIIIGTIISSIGFAGLLFSHSTEIFLAINLAVISIGVALTNVGSQNVVMIHTPKQSSGMSLAMTSLLKLIGSAIGPALAAMYLQNFQYTIDFGKIIHSFPSSESYNLIFATSFIVSVISVFLAIILKSSTKVNN